MSLVCSTKREPLGDTPATPSLRITAQAHKFGLVLAQPGCSRSVLGSEAQPQGPRMNCTPIPHAPSCSCLTRDRGSKLRYREMPITRLSPHLSPSCLQGARPRGLQCRPRPHAAPAPSPALLVAADAPYLAARPRGAVELEVGVHGGNVPAGQRLGQFSPAAVP